MGKTVSDTLYWSLIFPLIFLIGFFRVCPCASVAKEMLTYIPPFFRDFPVQGYVDIDGTR